MTKVIRSYNKMAVVLLQYELLHLQGWTEAAESAPHCLNAALLVRHENSKVLDDMNDLSNNLCLRDSFSD